MNESANDRKKKPVLHEADTVIARAEPETNDRDYIAFVRDEANLAFRMMRSADQLISYLGRANDQLINDVLAQGVLRVKEAANCRKERF